MVSTASGSVHLVLGFPIVGVHCWWFWKIGELGVQPVGGTFRVDPCISFYCDILWRIVVYLNSGTKAMHLSEVWFIITQKSYIIIGFFPEYCNHWVNHCNHWFSLYFRHLNTVKVCCQGIILVLNSGDWKWFVGLIHVWDWDTMGVRNE